MPTATSEVDLPPRPRASSLPNSCQSESATQLLEEFRTNFRAVLW